MLEEKDDVLVELIGARADRKAAFAVYFALPENSRRPMVIAQKRDAAAKLAAQRDRVERAEARLEQLECDRTLVSHTCARRE